MSVYFNGTNALSWQDLGSSAHPMPILAMSFWLNLEAPLTSVAAPLYFSSGADPQVSWESDAGETLMGVEELTAGINLSYPYPLGAWRFYCFTRRNNYRQLWTALEGETELETQFDSATHDWSSTFIRTFVVGANAYSQSMKGWITQVRVWTPADVFSEADAEAEWYSATPVYADPVFSFPFLNNTNPQINQGSGPDLTVGGPAVSTGPEPTLPTPPDPPDPPAASDDSAYYRRASQRRLGML